MLVSWHSMIDDGISTQRSKKEEEKKKKKERVLVGSLTGG
jgi:hypothetical protein